MQSRLILSLSVMAALAAPAPLASAQTETTREVRVSTRDLDPSDPSALNARLVRAAKDVCGFHPGPMRMDELRAARECVRDAMQRRGA